MERRYEYAKLFKFKTIFLLPLPKVHTILRFFGVIIDIMVGEAGLEPATKAL